MVTNCRFTDRRALELPYSLRMLWRDRRRFLPALLAIGLSAVLDCRAVRPRHGPGADHVRPDRPLFAHLWVLPLEAPSLHQTSTFPLAWQSRLDLQPEIERSETDLTAMGRWRLPGRGARSCACSLGCVSTMAAWGPSRC